MYKLKNMNCMKLLPALCLVFIMLFSCSKDSTNDYIVVKEPKEELVDPPVVDPPVVDPPVVDPDFPDSELSEGIKYGEDFFVIEPEITESDLGKWVKRVPTDTKYYKGTGLEAINKGYLEFTGNNLNGGSPNSPLEYVFKSPKTGKFRVVARMYQPLLDGEAGDKRNDIWIKLKGDFTSATPNVYPTATLEADHKFWGRGVRKWGALYNLEAHVNDVKKQNKVVYNLTKDKNYKFTISGRAQGCSIDYFLFFEESLGLIANTQDLATQNPEKYRPDVITN
jgi:hypothetical protein